MDDDGKINFKKLFDIILTKPSGWCWEVEHSDVYHRSPVTRIVLAYKTPIDKHGEQLTGPINIINGKMFIL